MKITMELLEAWSACQEGIDWYGERPELEGAEHVIVCAALDADHQPAWSAWVRLAVASRLEDQTRLFEMRTDEDWWVRVTVASRLEDQTILAEMRNDKSAWVRRTVASRLEELSK